MTKFNIIVIVLCVLSSCTLDSKNTNVSTVTLAIEKNANDTVDFKIFDNFAFNDSIIASIILDSKGYGKATFELNSPTFAYLRMDEGFSILVVPNEHLEIQVKEEKQKVIGDQGVNNFLISVKKELNEIYIINNQPFFKSDEKTFLSKLSVVESKIGGIETDFFENHSIDNLTKQLLKDELNVRVNNFILNYILINQDTVINTNALLISSPSLLKANSTDYLANLNARLSLRYYTPIWKQHENNPEMRYNYISRILYDSILASSENTEIKEWLLARSIWDSYSNGGFSDILDSVFYDYTSAYGNTGYSKMIKSYIDRSKSIREGSKAPEIIGTTITGDSSSLSNLKGHPVVIDFWATWCGSCIKQFKFIDTLKIKYGDKVKFINVSIDENVDKWKKLVTSRNLSGLQLIATNPKATKKNYMIGGVPRYVMIDRNGLIFRIDTPHPSSQLFEDDLILLIEQNNNDG